MKGFWKKLFTVAAVAGVSYVGFQGYKRISAIMKLSKSLPEYLENIIEERPKVSISMTLNTIKISLGISQETSDKNIEIETHIHEYIEDFYPSLAKLECNITTYIKSEDDEDEEEENIDVNDDISVD